MHKGAFPAGDCDLGNWRYIKIDSLNAEHSKKLKELLMLDDIQTIELGTEYKSFYGGLLRE